jgi:hypothetical protein
MNNLKKALLIVKNTSEKDYQEVYDMIKDRYLDENVYLPTYNIDNLITELKDVDFTLEITQVAGISVTHQGNEKKLFPVPSYDWDGGSPIYTDEFNLKTLDHIDIGGGPTASISTHHNPNYPAFAIHYAPSESFGGIHIFM